MLRRWRPYPPLVGLLGVGILLRILVSVGFSPAYIANPDAIAYLDAAGRNLWGFPERPAGYPLFLRVADFALFGKLPLLIALQHALGVATGLLLYLAVRRFGAPRGVALLPAAAVLLTGDQVFFEHAVLSEALFGFLVVAAIYCSARALEGHPLPWALAAGVLLAGAATVRTVALFMLPVLGLWLLVTVARPMRVRLLSAGAAALAAVCVLGVYVVAQREATGFNGFSRTVGWSLYSRVAYFADCGRFQPPGGTRQLCQEAGEPRPGATFYHHDARSPAWRVFGRPPNGDAQLGAFARQVIVHQPFGYARAVVKDVVRYAFPDIGSERAFSGTAPDGLAFSEPMPDRLAESLGLIAQHWDRATFRNRFGGSLRGYQQVVRVHPILLPLLALLAIGGLWRGSRRERAGIALLASLALLTVLVSSATLIYNWRYLVPLLGPLVGAAALGGFALRNAWLERSGRPRSQRSPA